MSPLSGAKRKKSDIAELPMRMFALSGQAGEIVAPDRSFPLMGYSINLKHSGSLPRISLDI
jgi:hypothetical protein